MSPKTITVDDIRRGTIFLHPVDSSGDITIQCNYQYVDSAGDLIPDVDRVKHLNITVPFSSLPIVTQQAIADVEDWVSQQVLDAEGL